jgi:hypothetical protein
MIKEQEATVGLVKAGRPKKKRVSEKPDLRKPTLAEAGINKGLAHRASSVSPTR